MRAIPPKLRQEMADDPYYKVCCITDEYCFGKIEFHHNVIFAGRQLNEKWAIIPLCEYHHSIEKHRDIKKILNSICANRATDAELQRVSKVVNYFKYR